MAYVQQDDLDKAVLYRLFAWAQKKSDRVSPSQIAKMFEAEFTAKRIDLSLQSLENSELIQTSYGNGVKVAEISRHGYTTVEKELKQPATFYARYARYGDDWLEREPDDVFGIPAANRTVTLDHNSAEYAEIEDGLANLAKAIEGDNELDSNDRARFTSSIAAARELWKSTELQAIQLKVGVIMVIENIMPHAKAKFYDALVVGLLKAAKMFAVSIGARLDRF